jgi:hypothetical protein
VVDVPRLEVVTSETKFESVEYCSEYPAMDVPPLVAGAFHETWNWLCPVMTVGVAGMLGVVNVMALRAGE